MDNWYEVRTTCDTNINVAAPTSAIAFDPCQELLWAGNEKVFIDLVYKKFVGKENQF
jgi:hypothetical protein